MVVLLPFRGIKDNVMTLGGLDGSWSSISPGDWLEPILELDSPTAPRVPLLQVRARGPDRDQVTLEAPAAVLPLATDWSLAFRRWDHRAGRAKDAGLHEGAILIREGQGEANWIAIEDRLEVQFAPGPTHFRPGHYWLDLGRTAGDGQILRPLHHDGSPRTVQAHGACHHYAPLALIKFNPIAQLKQSCRSQFRGLALTAV